MFTALPSSFLTSLTPICGNLLRKPQDALGNEVRKSEPETLHTNLGVLSVLRLTPPRSQETVTATSQLYTDTCLVSHSTNSFLKQPGRVGMRSNSTSDLTAQTRGRVGRPQRRSKPPNSPARSRGCKPLLLDLIDLGLNGSPKV